jgi:Transposase DDE domain group 1
MVQPEGEVQSDALRLDRRLKLEFHGSSVTSDAGLLPYRELDAVLGLMAIAGQHVVDRRTGRNGRHDLVGMLRQSVFGRLAGYEDVKDATGWDVRPMRSRFAGPPTGPTRRSTRPLLA